VARQPRLGRVAMGILGVLHAAGAIPACASSAPVPTGSRIHWACTTLNARQQYFRGYGTSREQAFQMAMNRCRRNGVDPITCMGSPDRCSPPVDGG